MKTYNIVLSTTDDLSLSYAVVSQFDWIDNAVKERCRIAKEEIIKIAVDKCLEQNIPIPGTKDEIVELAFQQQWVVPLNQK
jgi:hypothetical protein